MHKTDIEILLGNMAAKTLLAWEPVNDRTTARLQTRNVKCTIIQIYAPTNAAGDSRGKNVHSMSGYSEYV